MTAVRAVGANQAGYTQNIIFEGYSPTILLESGPSCRAFTNMNLQEIIAQTGQGTPENSISPFIKPVYKENIPYTVQYNESAFAFVNRLARRYGEWFYYDGEETVFGTKKQKELKLLYGQNLLNFEFGMQTGAVNHQFSAYGYDAHQTEKGKTNPQDSTIGGTAAFAMETSAKTWSIAEAAYLHQFDEESSLQKQLDDLGKLSTKASAARRVTFKGSSSHPGLFPGAFVQVDSVSVGGPLEYGKYIIIAVQHQYSEGGHYRNHFEAVPFDAEVSPQTVPNAFPYCSPQAGKVEDNKDPKGLGRVKVKLPWQQDTTTPWIRVAMPHSGADKGMFFVPETDDEVIVGFENGNAEKPYVMGSLYHGKAAPSSWKSDNNYIKAIKTKSGHTVQFQEEPGKEEIRISDAKGNFIVWSTHCSCITISAPGDLNLNAKNINVNAKENFTVAVGEEGENILSINGTDGELTMISKNKMEMGSQDDEVVIVGKTKTTVTGDELTLQGGSKAKLESADTDIV